MIIRSPAQSVPRTFQCWDLVQIFISLLIYSIIRLNFPQFLPQHNSPLNIRVRPMHFQMFLMFLMLNAPRSYSLLPCLYLRRFQYTLVHEVFCEHFFAPGWLLLLSIFYDLLTACLVVPLLLLHFHFQDLFLALLPGVHWVWRLYRLHPFQYVLVPRVPRVSLDSVKLLVPARRLRLLQQVLSHALPHLYLVLILQNPHLHPFEIVLLLCHRH